MAWDTGSWGFVCPECGAQLTKRTGKYGEFFGCANYPRCTHSALVGADGKPAEKADAVVREARIRAHRMFDKLWKPTNKHKRPHNGPVFASRYIAYEWLAQVMGVQHSKAHIKQFDVAQCEKVIYESRMLLYDDFMRSNIGSHTNLFGMKVVGALPYEQAKRRR